VNKVLTVSVTKIIASSAAFIYNFLQHQKMQQNGKIKVLAVSMTALMATYPYLSAISGNIKCYIKVLAGSQSAIMVASATFFCNF